MTDNIQKRDIAYAMDEFIKATGGNLDPRANGNKTRKALALFYSRMRDPGGGDGGALSFQALIDQVVKEKLSGGDWLDRKAVKIIKRSMHKRYNPAANL